MAEKLLKVGGVTPQRHASGISVDQNGFVHVRDTSQEGFAVGSVVYPSPEDPGIKTVFGLRVFHRVPLSVNPDRGAVKLSNGYVVAVHKKRGSAVSVFDESLNTVSEIRVPADSVGAVVSSNGVVASFGGNPSNPTLSTFDLKGAPVGSWPLIGMRHVGRVFSPIDSQGSFICAASNQTLVLLDGSNLVWERSFSNIGEISSGFLHVASCLFSEDGEKIVLMGRRITGDDESPSIAIFDVDTGDLLGYSTDEGGDAAYDGVIVEDNGFYISRGIVFSFDIGATGKFSLTHEFSTGISSPNLCVIDDGFAISANDGRLIAFDFAGYERFTLGNSGVLRTRGRFAYKSMVGNRAGHLYVQTDDSLMKLSTELVVKGYRL